ncbi:MULTISPECIES: oxidoreductase [unclassified Mycobacterium]|uniref:oxidoreductase n=1 Tax=unclassified Mycobacterium TaxID=2642494 RepID=UPI0029C858CA|nr:MULTISPECIES: oxidoreductase [unclassified Mycobacterium]
MDASRIALVGPGAIGSTIAALVHAAGHPVLLCGRTPRKFIELRPDDGDPIVVPGPVHTDPATVEGPVDVVLLAVKDTQNEASAGWLARLCDANTVVLALQNGVEQVERVGRYCPESTVVPCVVWFSADTQPEGWVRLRTPVRLVLPDVPAADRLIALLRGPRLSIDTDPDFLTAAWHKLLVNAVMGLMVPTGRKMGMFRRPDVVRLARAYLAECLEVAAAEGANLGDEVVDQIIAMFTALPEDMTTSILTDREQGRALEWDVRNGVINRKAADHHLSTPISHVLVSLLAAASDGPG